MKLVSVRALRPGDKVQKPNSEETLTFITSGAHGLAEALRMVVWCDEQGNIIFDALGYLTTAGHLVPQGDRARLNNLRKALAALEVKPTASDQPRSQFCDMDWQPRMSKAESQVYHSTDVIKKVVYTVGPLGQIYIPLEHTKDLAERLRFWADAIEAS